jgi:hypothetical protein
MLGSDEVRDLTSTEKAILAKGFATGLKDPDSAKFQWAKNPQGYAAGWQL